MKQVLATSNRFAAAPISAKLILLAEGQNWEGWQPHFPRWPQGSSTHGLRSLPSRMVWLRVAGAPFHLLPSLFYYSPMFLLRWRPCRNWEVFSPWTSVAEESLTLSPLSNYLRSSDHIQHNTDVLAIYQRRKAALYILYQFSIDCYVLTHNKKRTLGGPGIEVKEK